MSKQANGPKVHNKRAMTAPVDPVYIGRPSIWGNPFVIGRDGDRDAVIAKFEAYLDSRPELLTRLGELRGEHLVCWCAPARCHGDVLLRRANR